MALMLLSNLAPLEALNSNGDIERAWEKNASSQASSHFDWDQYQMLVALKQNECDRSWQIYLLRSTAVSAIAESS
jgi:hypothetical protein